MNEVMGEQRAGLVHGILDRLAIGNRVGFRYRTLERLGLEAMERALAQGLLREIHRAETIPDPQRRTLYDLEVRHTSEGIIAVSEPDDEWIDPVPLTEDDIRQFELVNSKLFSRICVENQISQVIRQNEHEIVYLGEMELEGHGLVMTFLLYNNTEELRFMERCRRISGDRWTVALTPVPVKLSLQSQRQLAQWRLLLVPLSHYLGGEGWTLPWRKIAANHLGLGKAAADVQPLADQVFDRLPGLECSPDFRTVRLRGESFNLTPMMAQLFKAMVEMSVNGPRDLAKDAILERGESESKSMADVFKHLKNWRKLIVPGRQRGTYRINIPYHS